MNIFSNIFSSQTIAPSAILTIVFSLVLALATGLFIAWVYRHNYRGVMYSNNFTLSLIMMTLITCPPTLQACSPAFPPSAAPSPSMSCAGNLNR